MGRSLGFRELLQSRAPGFRDFRLGWDDGYWGSKPDQGQYLPGAKGHRASALGVCHAAGGLVLTCRRVTS